MVESLFEKILEYQSLQSDFSLTSNPGTALKKKSQVMTFCFEKAIVSIENSKWTVPEKNTKRFILSFWSIYLLEMICGPAHNWTLQISVSKHFSYNFLPSCWVGLSWNSRVTIIFFPSTTRHSTFEFELNLTNRQIISTLV